MNIRDQPFGIQVCDEDFKGADMGLHQRVSKVIGIIRTKMNPCR